MKGSTTQQEQSDRGGVKPRGRSLENDFLEKTRLTPRWRAGKRGCCADKDEVHPGKDKFQVWLPDGRHAGWCKAKEQEASSAQAWMPMLLYPAKTEKEPGGGPLGT